MFRSISTSEPNVEEHKEDEEINKNSEIAESFTLDSFNNQPHQPKDFHFPTRRFDNDKKERSFQSKWFEKYPWLHYDVKSDAAFCCTCINAAKVGAISSNKSEENFTKVGYTNWKKTLEKGKGFSKHENSSSHKEAMERTITAPQSSKGDIAALINHQCADEQLKKRMILRKIIQNIRFLARQSLSLRGNWDDNESCEIDSNYHQSLVLRSIDDETIAKWLTESDSKNKYNSPEIQNEIIEIMALHVLREIAKNIQNAGIYTIMADETADVSNTEQLVFCIRWVDEHLIPHEDFIGMHPLPNTMAKGIVAVIKDILLRLNLKVEDSRGQCYDGASNMTGAKSGVATKIKALNSKCLFTHCYGHALNLAIGDVIRNILALKETFAAAYEICKLVKKSPKRDTKLHEIRSSMKNEFNGVQTLCPTRWTVCGDTLASILNNFEELMKLWDWSLNETKDSEMIARIQGVKTIMSKFEFLFSCSLGERLLKQTDNLSKALQNSTISAAQGQALAHAVVKTLSKDPCDERYELFWSNVLKRKDALEILDPVLPRKRKMPDYFGRQNADTHHFHQIPKDFYRQIHFETFDCIINCIERRFDQSDFKIYVHLQELIVKAIKGEGWDEEVKVVTDFFGLDFDETSLKVQLELLPEIAKSLGYNNRSFSISDVISLFQALDSATKTLISEVVKVARLLLVMPATNAVSERSFSALKRVKTYLRSTMSDNRINHLMTLHVHKLLTDKIDIDEVAKEFVERREGRKATFGLFK